MDEPLLNTTALRQPRNRQLMIILGVALLALLAILAIWQTSGSHGARRDLSAANDRVSAKQREDDDALRTYQQKVAELRAVRADADVQATKLGSVVDRQVEGTVNEARVDAPADPAVAGAGEVAQEGPRDYYVRDRHGRFVRVVAP